MKHSVLVRVHRYIGLTVAAFLILAGLTGAIISWDRELDGWINRDLAAMTVPGRPLSPGALEALIEAREPRGQVTYFPLRIEAGTPAQFSVRPKIDRRTGQPFELGYTQVFVDPVTGSELGHRDGDGYTLSRRAIVPFLIRFHHSLQIPEMWGIADWGLWITGTVALAWFLGLIAGLFVTLPKHRGKRSTAACADRAMTAGKSFWQRWKPAWQVRLRSGSFPLTFDLHRAVGLWVMPILLLVSFTAFTQNILGPWLPEPLAIESPAPTGKGGIVGVDEAVRIAGSEASLLGWSERPDEASFDPGGQVYRIYFAGARGGLGGGDVGMKTITLDSSNGAVLSRQTRWTGSPGEIYVKVQFPLHSMRLFGLPGRIVSSIVGVLVLLMTVTGLLVWARKRAAKAPRRRTVMTPGPDFAR